MKMWMALLVVLVAPLSWGANEMPAENRYVGGQPSAADLQRLAASGVRHVINLRPAAEQVSKHLLVAADVVGVARVALKRQTPPFTLHGTALRIAARRARLCAFSGSATTPDGKTETACL